MYLMVARLQGCVHHVAWNKHGLWLIVKYVDHIDPRLHHLLFHILLLNGVVVDKSSLAFLSMPRCKVSLCLVTHIGVCTLVNLPDARQCEACSTPRPIQIVCIRCLSLFSRESLGPLFLFIEVTCNGQLVTNFITCIK
jgi:hypothetical protein